MAPTVTMFSRAAIRRGEVPCAPKECGVVMRSGKLCTACPIWLSANVFTCGRHVGHTPPSRDAPPPPPPSEIVGECSICIESCMRAEARITECKHVFHIGCISKWSKNSCPMCRAPLTGDLKSRMTAKIGEALTQIDRLHTAKSRAERLCELLEYMCVMAPELHQLGHRFGMVVHEKLQYLKHAEYDFEGGEAFPAKVEAFEARLAPYIRMRAN